MTGEWTASPMVVFDLETTGVQVEADRIVTACVAPVSTPMPVTPSRWLVNPGIDIPEAATAVHGITTAQARADGVDPAWACAEILTGLRAHWAAGDPVVIYNAAFDLTLLDREVRRHGVAEGIGPVGLVIDPLVLDRHVDRFRRGKRTLAAACSHYGVRHDGAHDSTEDALAAGRVAWAILRQHPELDELSADDLMAVRQNAHRGWATEFGAYLARQGKPEVIDPSWPLRPVAVAS